MDCSYTSPLGREVGYAQPEYSSGKCKTTEPLRKQ